METCMLCGESHGFWECDSSREDIAMYLEAIWTRSDTEPLQEPQRYLAHT